MDRNSSRLAVGLALGAAALAFAPGSAEAG